MSSFDNYIYFFYTLFMIIYENKIYERIKIGKYLLFLDVIQYCNHVQHGSHLTTGIMEYTKDERYSRGNQG